LPARRPRVVVHVAVSLDGATIGFDPDVARFYELARTWDEDVTLAGADTILAQEEALASAPRPGPAADGPLLAVVDGRRRVRHWAALRACGHWSDVIALRAAASPARAGGDAVRELVIGLAQVDLAAALTALRDREGAELIRVDSGGELIGALLRARLVDELSLLVHPCLAGAAGGRRWFGAAPLPSFGVDRVAAEPLDDGLVWLRYGARTASRRSE
jgi:2,5-diamino-6-(ribosylamino)-4(3H)-pyrimidinone 5'-phosphate reductase